MKAIINCSAVLALLLFSTGINAEIVVQSVKGQASYKAGNQWVPLQNMMRLQEGAKISTGPSSTVVLKINKHTLTVRPLTMIKVAESRDTADSSNTRIGLRRGMVRASVDRDKRVKTVFKVSTPVATSSVRGTEEIISYGPGLGMVIRVIQGDVEGNNTNGANKYLTGRLIYRQKSGTPYPEPLLADVIDQAIVDIMGRGFNFTPAEQQAYGMFGNETGNLTVGIGNGVSGHSAPGTGPGQDGRDNGAGASMSNIFVFIRWNP
ncbi:MAG: FecR domain-containing protein [Spirochaetes bacterium]|jgi:hypothetical protein|nr:FecR domain-containing protein [Spirochaetota bacterium]